MRRSVVGKVIPTEEPSLHDPPEAPYDPSETPDFTNVTFSPESVQVRLRKKHSGSGDGAGSGVSGASGGGGGGGGASCGGASGGAEAGGNVRSGMGSVVVGRAARFGVAARGDSTARDSVDCDDECNRGRGVDSRGSDGLALSFGGLLLQSTPEGEGLEHPPTKAPALAHVSVALNNPFTGKSSPLVNLQPTPAATSAELPLLRGDSGGGTTGGGGGAVVLGSSLSPPPTGLSRLPGSSTNSPFRKPVILRTSTVLDTDC